MRVLSLLNNFTSGVLSPALAARSDLRQYQNGLKTGRNVVCRPEGGLRRRGGFNYKLTLPQKLSRLTGMTITASNGGTTANANDNSTATVLTTTVNISTTNPYVVAHYDLGAAQTVKFADVRDVKLTAGTSTEFVVQYSTDNVSWTTVGAALELVDTTGRTYRRHPNVSARYWRVARVGATDLGTAKAELSEFNLWVETGVVSETRLFSFEFDVDTEYLVIATDYCFTIVDNATKSVVAYTRSDFASADLAAMDYAQSANTGVFVHGSYAPARLLRRSSARWDYGALPFDSVPQYDYNDSSSPTPTSCVQTLVFGGVSWVGGATWGRGDKFKLDVNGALTADIVFAGDSTADEQAKTAENIRREVQKLYTVGFTGISVARSGALTYVVTFAEDSADAYDLMVGVPITGDAANRITITLTTPGVSRQENVWSATRGYPSVVTFHNGRLYLAGVAGVPTAVFASRTGGYFDFDPLEGLDDDPIFVSMVSDNLNAPVALFSSRALFIGTKHAEFIMPEEPVTPDNGVPRIQTRFGVAKVRPVSNDGAVLFVQRTRNTVREFVFGQEEEAYGAPPKSVLASHLLSGVVDMTAWSGNTEDQANLVLLVNDDGTLAVLVTLRSQDINAWFQWTTGTAGAPGLFKSVCAVDENIWAVIRRTIGGTAYNYLELYNESAYLDSSVSGTNGPASTSLTGLSHLNSEVCRLRADGLTHADVTPSGGTATADRAVEDWEVGLSVEPYAEPMPLAPLLQDGSYQLRKKRVVKVRLDVKDTLGLEVNGRALPDLRTDIDSFDTAPDPYTGGVELEESGNWDWRPATINFGQTDPMPMEVLALEVQLEVEGG